MTRTGSGISDAELARLESTGWWYGEKPDVARLREMAAKDRPTLRTRFTDEFELPSASRGAHIADFFANKAWSNSKHRLLIVQAGLQATAARALDKYLAGTVLSNLQRIGDMPLPSTPEDAFGSLWGGELTLARYLNKLPQVKDIEDFTADKGFPGAGASRTDEGDIRIHMPMTWINEPLGDVLSSAGAGFNANNERTRNPWLVLSSVLVTFAQQLISYSTPNDVRDRVREAVLGESSSTWLNMRASADAYKAAVVLGLVGIEGKVPFRKMERIGGPMLGRSPADLTDLLEWCRVNRTKPSRFPARLSSGALNDKEIIGAMLDSADAVELYISAMPARLVERATGVLMVDRPADIEVRISSCVRIPKALAQYVSQSEDPSLESVSLWASQGYEYAALKGLHQPGPHPNTADQVRRFQDIIKASKSTSDDGISVAPTGWMMYLPDVTLPEFEQNMKDIADLSTARVGGVDMYDPELVDMLSVVPLQFGRTPAQSYESLSDEDKETAQQAFRTINAGLDVENVDPVPKDPPVNTILYTNWNLGIVTWTTSEGKLTHTEINSWRPVRAQHLLRFIRTHEFATLGASGRSMPSQLEYICEHFGLSTRISDYVRPEDASIFLPAAQRSELQTDRGSGTDLIELPVQQRRPGRPGGEIDLDVLYGTNISNLAVSINRVFGYLTTLRDELSANPELAEQWSGGGDGYEMSRLLPALQAAMDLGGDREWAAMFELAVPGTDIVLPSPFRFIRRIMEDIHQKSGGDYGSLMGGERPFFTGLSPVIGLVVAMNRYTSLKEIVDGDREERGAYFDQNELDPNEPVEPVPNIGKDAFFLPHQAKYDQRFAKDPEKQIVAVDTGGGKTIMGSIQRGVRTLAKGGKVLIVCPNSLAANYIDDVAVMTDGKVNVFSLDRVIYQRYRDEGRLQDLYDMINGAPPNTLFVLGMQTLSAGETTDFYYAGAEITKSDIVELMRQVDWRLIIVDESHKIKNPSSNAYRNLASMFRDAPQMVQMTGTYITDTVMDVWKQSSLMEPGLFGQEADFVRQHYESVGRTMMPMTNAAPRAMKKLEDVTDLVQIRRVEWAAWLPERVDEFEPCDDLTEAQFLAYESIFDSAVGRGNDDGADDDEIDGVQGDRMETDNVLGYSLSRLERFLTAMDLDHSLPKELKLKGDDRISPKIHKIVEILDRHFADPDAGKVLIFTQWRDTATSIAHWVGVLRPKYKERTLHYLAEKKKQMIPIIKSPGSGKDIIVGVQRSLQEGENLQVATRIIMCETPWSPGDLTQAEGRIFRPEPKRDDGRRGKVWFTSLLIDNTVDMVKAARLVSKRLHAARGNNRDNPEYAAINKNFGIIKMGKRTLRAVRSWNDVPPAPSLARDEEFGSEKTKYYSLSEYLSYVGISAPGTRPVRNNLLEIERREIERIREEGKGAPVPIPSGGTMRGSRMMSTLPYTPNMHLPFESDLGLRNIAQWAAEELYVGETDIPKEELIGKLVHTEFGDGIIRRYGTGGKYRSSHITVELADGSKIRVTPVSAAFFITDPELLEGKSVKVRMAEMSGIELSAGGHNALRKSIVDHLDGAADDDDDYDDTLLDEEDEGYPDDEDLEDLTFDDPEEETDPELAPDADAPHGYWRDPDDGSLYPVYRLKAEVASINGQFAILTYAQPDGAPQIEEDYDEASGIQSTVIGSYFYTDVSTRRRYVAVMKSLIDANKKGIINLIPESKSMLTDLNDKFETDPQGKRMGWNFGAAETVSVRQFHLDNRRRRRGNALAVYPVVWRDVVSGGDGDSMRIRSRVLLMAHEDNQTAARKLPSLTVVGAQKWRRDGTGFTIRFYRTKREAQADFAELAEFGNIEIVNLDEVRAALRTLRVRRGRS